MSTYWITVCVLCFIDAGCMLAASVKSRKENGRWWLPFQGMWCLYKTLRP